MAYPCDPSTWKVRQEDKRFKASLRYIVRLTLSFSRKKKKKKKEANANTLKTKTL